MDNNPVARIFNKKSMQGLFNDIIFSDDFANNNAGTRPPNPDQMNGDEKGDNCVLSVKRNNWTQSDEHNLPVGDPAANAVINPGQTHEASEKDAQDNGLNITTSKRKSARKSRKAMFTSGDNSDLFEDLHNWSMFKEPKNLPSAESTNTVASVHPERKRETHKTNEDDAQDKV